MLFFSDFYFNEKPQTQITEFTNEHKAKGSSAVENRILSPVNKWLSATGRKPEGKDPDDSFIWGGEILGGGVMWSTIETILHV